jgi:hypothetical protein
LYLPAAGRSIDFPEPRLGTRRPVALQNGEKQAAPEPDLIVLKPGTLARSQYR